MFRSAEMAGIAGTTVRTLRHYHAIGLLPEPPRTAGGYRIYDVQDLLRLLRIRRMAALGIPLERVGELLDVPADEVGNDAELDALDADLSARIEELTRRRDQLRQSRSSTLHGARLDVPVVVAGYVDRLREAGAPAEALAFETGAAVLMDHFDDQGLDPATSTLGRLYGQLAEEETFTGILELARAMHALPPEAGEDQIEEVARRLVVLANSLASEEPFTVNDPVLPRLLEQFAATTLTEVQRDALSRAGARLSPAE